MRHQRTWLPGIGVGDFVALSKLAVGAADRIEPYAAAPYGVAVAALTTWAHALASRIEQHGSEIPEASPCPNGRTNSGVATRTDTILPTLGKIHGEAVWQRRRMAWTA
jgi:hypothetical protein